MVNFNTMPGKVKVLVLPPPRFGGGPSNAILRILRVLEKKNFEFTTSYLSNWSVALVNVGIGIRLQLLEMVNLNRQYVYRVDGCFSKEIFARQDRPWDAAYDIQNQKIKKVLRKAGRVIYQSQFSKEILDEILYKREDRFAIIPNGVDLSVFSPAVGNAGTPPVLGCIGAFRSNRVKTILRIIERIKSPIKMLLVGRLDEECRRDLSNYHASPHTQKHIVEYVPPVAGEAKLVEYYRMIDCFLHPVIGDTCSNAVAEALACGVPVVLPDYSGSSGMVGMGGIRIMQSPWENYERYLDETACAVEKIIESRANYSRLARQQAVDYLDIEKTSENYAREILSLL
jgi:glycosyltransferase involved in cell wall biosynthesis